MGRKGIAQRPIDRLMVQQALLAQSLIHGELVSSGAGLHKSPSFTSSELGRCAVGALLFHAGYTDQQIRRLPADVRWLKRPHLRKLYEVYGLNQRHLINIMNENDRVVEDDGQDLSSIRLKKVLNRLSMLKDSPFLAPN